jgi:hypothetical protein
MGNELVCAEAYSRIFLTHLPHPNIDGKNWAERISLHEILGSGCIAQVYKGVVVDQDGKKEEVAVKGKDM